MKKHILFLSGGLKIGGVERVLIEYLNNIDREKYKITLFLMSDFGSDAVLEPELKKDIQILKRSNLNHRTIHLLCLL